VSGSPSTLKTTLRSLRGKPVVVNFWATWCEPCKNEMPRLVAAAKKYDGRVQFLGVDVEDDLRTASSFIKRYGMRFKSVSDPNGDIRHAERILGLPVTQFYTSAGDLAFLHNGEIQTDELQKKIEGVLADRARSSG
jgi:cytochrome c biogenesis protein CcmG, thiol:disulfide interchange protein DsbE